MGEVFQLVETFDDDPGGELSWQDRALCAETDPEAFFPEKGGSTREAKKVCLSCDVRPGQRRALRHLGWSVRARATAAEEARRLGTARPGRPAGDAAPVA
jgi:hypothetical protein